MQANEVDELHKISCSSKDQFVIVWMLRVETFPTVTVTATGGGTSEQVNFAFAFDTLSSFQLTAKAQFAKAELISVSRKKS